MLTCLSIGFAVSLLCHGCRSMIFPQNYDWESMRNISMIEKDVSWLENGDYDDEKLRKSCNWIMRWGFLFSFVSVIVVPIICIPIGIFNKVTTTRKQACIIITTVLLRVLLKRAALLESTC